MVYKLPVRIIWKHTRRIRAWFLNGDGWYIVGARTQVPLLAIEGGIEPQALLPARRGRGIQPLRVDPALLPWEGPLGELAPKSRYRGIAMVTPAEEQLQRLKAARAEEVARRNRCVC